MKAIHSSWLGRVLFGVVLGMTFTGNGTSGVMSAWAAPVEAFRGTFELLPASGHTAKITGSQTIFHEGGAISLVQMDLDQPVFGRKQYVSKEQIEALPVVSGKPRLLVAFQLKLAPHKWVYVLVAESNDGGITYQGNLYRSDDDFARIQTVFAAGAVDIPAQWKIKGTTILKKSASLGGDEE